MNNKNLFNRIFNRSFRKSSKSSLQLTKELQEIIFGLILGDLFAERRNAQSNTRLQIKQSYKNKEYVLHLFSLFNVYCGSLPKEYTWFDKKPNKNQFYSSIKFWTLSLPCFNIFRKLFYDSKGIKIIPENLGENFTARSWTYWLMDDGYNTVDGFYFCTESFTKVQNEQLAKMLKDNFYLDYGVHKQFNGYKLYVFSNSKNKLLELVKPYLLIHFYFKFNISVYN